MLVLSNALLRLVPNTQLMANIHVICDTNLNSNLGTCPDEKIRSSYRYFCTVTCVSSRVIVQGITHAVTNVDFINKRFTL